MEKHCQKNVSLNLCCASFEFVPSHEVASVHTGCNHMCGVAQIKSSYLYCFDKSQLWRIKTYQQSIGSKMPFICIEAPTLTFKVVIMFNRIKGTMYLILHSSLKDIGSLGSRLNTNIWERIFDGHTMVNFKQFESKL